MEKCKQKSYSFVFHIILFNCYGQFPFGVISGGSGNGLPRSLAHSCGESRDYLNDPVLTSTLSVARGNIKTTNLVTFD
jgi:hypothetical protein